MKGKITIQEIKALKGKVPKACKLDAKVLVNMDDNVFKLSDATDGILLSLEQRPELCKELGPGKFVRIISFEKQDDLTIVASKHTVISITSPFGVKSLKDIAAFADVNIQSTTFKDLANKPGGTHISKMTLQVVYVSPVKQYQHNKKSWIRVKDSNGELNVLNFWEPHCLDVQLEEEKIYTFKKIKVDNFPPTRFPKNIGTTERTLVCEPTKDELKEMSAIISAYSDFNGTIVAFTDCAKYKACPFDQKSMTNAINNR